MALSSAQALANGFEEERPWQFRSAYDRFVEAQVADLRLRQEAGGFTLNSTTNIDRQVNCNLQSSAVGNSSSATHSGAGIAPIGVQGSPIGASSAGNTGTTASQADGNPIFGSPLNTSPAGNSVAGSQSNSGPDSGPSSNELGGSIGGLNQTTHQSNNGSAIDSNVTGSTIQGALGPIDASGASIQNSLDVGQSNSNGTISSAVADSSACNFVSTP
jgi:hypothetical protein